LALGDSYTIGQSVSESARWPNQLSDTLSKLGYIVDKTQILATTGWTTSNLLNAISTTNLDRDYNLISILIGVNNFYQGKPVDLYRKELPVLIDSALNHCNNDTSSIFMVTIPDYGYTPFGQSNQSVISERTDLYNSIKDSIGLVYGIPVYNITDISRMGIIRPDLVASDGLHPSGSQYKLWVDEVISNLIPSSVGVDDLNVDWRLNEGTLYINAIQKETSLEIFNINGQLLFRKDLSSNENHVIPLFKGVNIVRLASENKLAIKSFLN